MTLHVQLKKEGRWKDIIRLGPEDRAGSISDIKQNRRDVYVFKCNEDGTSSLLRSKSGVDVEKEDVRVITTVGLETIKLLRRGESYEMNVKSPGGTDYSVRFMNV